MSSVLTQNYFDIFSLPRRYGLDRSGLDARYRDLQRSVHPDRFASGSDHERRVSMQQAARVSQRTAYFHLGYLVEVDETDKIFTNPSHKLTEHYITGRFG